MSRATQPAGARRAGFPATLALLAAAILSQACISARPWRNCMPPCDDKQLARAGTVLVDTHDGDRVLLTHATAGEDERGPFLAGRATVEGKPLGTVKVYTDVACAIHTRRVEAARIGANVVLVPLAILGEIILDASGLGIGEWELPSEPLPAGCPPPPEELAAPEPSAEAGPPPTREQP